MHAVGIISGTAERNDCVSFRILQEYDNLRNGTAERSVIGRNGTLILTLPNLTIVHNPHSVQNLVRAACRRQTAQHNTGSSTGVDDAKATWYAHRRSYRDLCQMKRSAFWCDTVECDRESPRKLWRSVNQLLGRGRPPASSCITVDEFSRFFSEKVNAVRSSTDGAPEPVFFPACRLEHRWCHSHRLLLTTSFQLYLVWLPIRLRFR